MNEASESTAARLSARDGIKRFPSPRIELFQLDRFVAPELCTDLIALIDKDSRPSTIADDNGDQYFRTSETCDLSHEEPAVIAVESLLREISGIDPRFGEPIQGQRYAEGQEFKPHTDYFAPGGQDYEKYCSVAGQRTWTLMMYLNEPDAGGGTRFKALKKMFQPKTGKLLCWNNQLSNGRINPNTLHHGLKVRKGLKYVLTKWYREGDWG